MITRSENVVKYDNGREFGSHLMIRLEHQIVIYHIIKQPEERFNALQGSVVRTNCY